jgi:hypothetical protein
VAVGRALQQRDHAEVAAGAGPVLDHDVLLQFLGQTRGHQARGHVGGAARRVGNDDAQRLGREGGGLRERGRGGQQCGAEHGDTSQQTGEFHGFSWCGKGLMTQGRCRPQGAGAPVS